MSNKKTVAMKGALPKTPIKMELQIRPHQIEHFNRLNDIVSKFDGYLDTSDKGAGKTILTIAMAKRLKLSLIVIGPLDTINMWKEECNIYGVHLIKGLTYHCLRGTNISPPKNGLLNISDDDGTFVSSPEFIKLIKKGVLLVFDEVSNLKNQTLQLNAAHTLVNTIVSFNKIGKVKSKVALLSATPCDKPEKIDSILKMLGFISSEELYNYDQDEKKYNLLGIQELINSCLILNKGLTE